MSASEIGVAETRVGADVAQKLGERTLQRLGAPEQHAATQISQLVEADLRGRPSHGMQRLSTLAARIRHGVLDPVATPVVARTARSGISVDGANGFGPVAAHSALEALTTTANGEGVAVAGIRRAGHIGMLAPYLERLADQGLIGIVMTTSEALVHPAGGRTPLIGTNPIGVGVPAAPHHFVLDMATAAISAGEVIAHRDRGQSLPEGCAVDERGRPTTDPAAALSGALSPFGGAKGYGLAVAVELLVATLTGTALGSEVTGTLDDTEPVTKGDVMIAIAPTAFAARAAGTVEAYLTSLRTSPTAPGVPRVLVPGDRMRDDRARRLQDGIAYPEPLWKALLDLEGDGQ